MSAARLSRWFASRDWKPFAFQRETWRAYLDGASGLVHAPTGIGKTLAVWGGPLLAGMRRRRGRKPRKTAEPLRVLWITPLRALASDTVAALHEPVESLELPWSIEKRTGDTPQARKVRQRQRFPTALVTTPESLSILLSYPETRERFATLECVIVDEWHELIGTKRGVQTELCLARLRHWNPALRTWGLSATLGNLEEARDVLLGHPGRDDARLISSDYDKRIEIETLLPDEIERFPWSGHLGTRLVPQVLAAIERARSSLLFTNTRSQAELWFRSILLARPDWLGRIALHHGSLDRKLRTRVEDLLKEGGLQAVVCTSSLDLGVDFAPVEQVFQLGSPKGIARLVQRAGRSGHQPGQVSRVVCVPTHAFELVEFAAARAAVEARAIEARHPLELTLDVLAQHAVTVALGGGFAGDDLLAEVRTTHAFRRMTDQQWAWTLDFVTRGGPSLTAYPEYQRVTREDGRYVVASRLVGRQHRLNIGTITDASALTVKLTSGRKLGTIEESFIARLAPGDIFGFAGRTLELVSVRGQQVLARRTKLQKGRVPRWNGGRFPLSTQLADAVRGHMPLVSPDSPAEELRAAAPLLELQARWSLIPAGDEILIEMTRTRAGHHVSLFPFEGRLVHEGLAALLAYRIARRAPCTIDLTVNDYGIELLSGHALLLDEGDWRVLLSEGDLLEDLLACVNETQMARRQFRAIARIAGLIFNGYPGAPRQGRQLQASSDMFFDVFRDYDPDNLLLDQARREVLEQQLEVRRLRRALRRIAGQALRLVTTERLTPLSFPLNAERLRAQYVTSERWSDRVRRMVQQLERAAERTVDSHA